MSIAEDTLNKTAYLGETEDGYSKYVLYLESREVLYIYASKTDADHRIWISKPFSEDRIVTAHQAALTDDMTRISAMSIKRVAYAYMPWMIADLYVPKV